MKAWNVTKTNELCGTIVFAKTATVAKALALRSDVFKDANYRDLRAHRMPKIDGLASTLGECDWDDPKLIIALVREYGWSCKVPDVAKCESCPAAEWCDGRAEKGGGEG